MYSFTPEEIVGLLGHHATITVKSQKSNPIKGYLYTIDPETNNIVLFDTTRVLIVMNHDVGHLEIDNQNQLDLSLIDSILKYQSQNKFTQEWIDKQRLNVLQLLEKNRIPFQYQEPVIHVLGSARVEYPYVATSVVCDNALIRKRVRDLLLQLSR
ncbi:hypothetical protein INT48_008187 [Thamnidium elegans]|uniref:AD domain-containing protein n=1 Tax=Thamnidium elegans TaxID=101142 RepID=A0A8H7W298_9FUNG|nr:hypothetical protein INT48_008187 [Thamnidium elegans]